MHEILNIILRSILAFIVLFISTKLLSKRSIQNMTYFDYIATLTIGTISGNLAFNDKIKISIFIASLLIMTALIMLVSHISLKSRFFRKFLAGNPTVIIENGKMLKSNMSKLKYSYDSLNQQLRQKKIFDIGQVEFAVLEPDGRLSVQLKSQNRPLTPKDLNLSTKYEGLAVELILEGKIIEENLKHVNLNKQWLYKELNKKGIKEVKDVAFASLATNGNLYVDRY